MLKHIKSYFLFLLKSNNQYGVHSPFVYDLVVNCFYKKVNPKQKKSFLKYRKELLSDNRTIDVNDFGAGSKVFKSNSRKVNKIAKHVALSNKRAFLLIRLIAFFKSQNILEIGTSLGTSTAAMAIANPNSNIETLEGCTNTLSVATEQFKKHQFTNITTHNGNFEKLLLKILPTRKWDFIFIDGNHTKIATLNYFNQCLPNCHNNSVLVFDDIHWNSEMESAWKEIKEHKDVTATIDTYQWGFVFLRKEQAKEHFTIRV